jgi:hypothetical protein
MATIHQLRTRKTEVRKSVAKRGEFFRLTIMIFPELYAKARRLAILVIATLTTDFKQMVVDYIDRRFGQAGRNTAE